MNFAHIHLILNHIPLLSLPVALIFLGHSLSTGLIVSRRFAYLVLVAAAATVVPVYFTGEPAEDLVENVPGVSRPMIEEHEEAAEISMVLTLMAGATAMIGLFGPMEGRKSKVISRAVIAVVLVAIASLGYTANMGGKIRHSELRPESSSD